ncbi:MAG: hypothetical protein EBQ96_06235 [Proteobacteria bacterium]|nr:hypothetical protein [Pseudomonadota bacterium]
MSQKVSTVFYIDDHARGMGTRNLEAIFGEKNVLAFASTEAMLEAYAEGNHPHAIITDATDGGDEGWGADNIIETIKWYRDNAPDKTPRHFLFTSADRDRAKRCRRAVERFLKEEGIENTFQLYVFDKGEMDLAAELAKGEVPRSKFYQDTDFREFLAKTTDHKLPITEEEIEAWQLARRQYSSKDLVDFVRKGKFNRDEALEILGPEARNIAATELSPRVNRREMDEPSRFSSGFNYESLFKRMKRRRVERNKRDLAMHFLEAAGQSAGGYIAFTISQVEQLAREGKKAVLVMRRYSPDFIEHLDKISGVILTSSRSTGHMRMLLNAHNVAGALGTRQLPLFLHDTQGRRIRYGIDVSGTGKSRVLEDRQEALEEAARYHRGNFEDQFPATTSYRAIERKIPKLKVSLRKFKPLSRLKFGSPVTLDIQRSYATVWPFKIGIIGGSWESYNNWMYDIPYMLTEWHEENKIPQLKIKMTVDTDHVVSMSDSGIGLMRTEHMILESKEARKAYKALLLNGDASAPATLTRILEAQLDNIIFRPSRGTPIRIRLADLPPDEIFSKQELHQIEAQFGIENARGVQLAQQLPALYEAQLRGIFSSMRDGFKRRESYINGFDEEKESWVPTIEIMVPTVRTVDELLFVKSLTRRIAAEYGFDHSAYRFGSMLETTGSCDNIADIAKHCAFLSIGSNDLTSEVLGCDRGDYQKRHDLMVASGEEMDPFLRLYPQVQDKIVDAVAKARAVKPNIQIDLCGDHATDIETLERLRPIKLNAISVTPTEQNTKGLRILYDYNTFQKVRASQPKPQADSIPTSKPA